MAEMQDAVSDLQLWRCRIEAAKRYRDQHGDTDGRWTTNVKALAGDFNSSSDLGADHVDVNLLRSTAKVVLPPLWINEPYITVTPTTEKYKGADNVRRAEVTELEINYWLRELKVRKSVRKCLVDDYTMNHGYLYIGYPTKKADVESTDGESVEPIPEIRLKRPFVRRISPKNVLLPPGIYDIEEAPWVDIIFYKPLDYVKDRYGEERTKDLTATHSPFEDKGSEASVEYKAYLGGDDPKLVELHNIWNKTDNKVYVMAKDHDQFLEEPSDWPYECDGFPLAHLSTEEIPDEYHATPAASYILPQNKELNMIRTSLARRARQTKRVIVVANEVEEAFKEAYQKAMDGDIIGLDLLDKKLNDLMQAIEPITISQSDLAYGAVVERDAIQQSGISAEQRGAGDSNVDSATASANIEKNAQVRNSDRGERVKEFYLDAVRKLWLILSQFPNEKRSRLIAGEAAGQFTKVEYTTEDLRGEFAFDFDLAAMLTDSPQKRQTQALLNYNLLRADPLVNPERLIFDIFKSQNIVDPSSYMLTLRQPDEELQMFLSGLPVEAHERDSHETHVAQHDQQSEQLDQQISQVGERTPMGEKLRLAQMLLIAHVQDHVRKYQAIAGQQQKRAGQPVAENMLRNQVRAGSSETEAELTGQPLSPETMVQ